MCWDVAVIGGGPAGCTAARDVACAGYRVIILEEHLEIGEPLQCSGLVSPRSLELSGYAGPVLGHMRGFCLHSPSGHTLSFRGAKVYAVVVDRVALDRQLAEEAARAGAEVMLGFKVTGLEYRPDGVVVCGRRRGGGDFRLKAKLVIAADGPRSTIARQLNLLPQEAVRMAAAEIRLGPETRARDSMVELFLGESFAPGWFGWLFPLEGGRARIGVGVAREGISSRTCLDRLIDEYPEFFAGSEILRRTGGIVPIGPPERLFADRVMLLGDAAAQVKPMSGGGLFLGLSAARLCASTAVAALNKGDLSEAALAAYQESWEENFGSALTSDLTLRELFLSLTEAEMDYLTQFFNNSFWRGLMANHADVDYPSALVSGILATGLLSKRFFKLALNLGGFVGRWRKACAGEEETAAASEVE